MSGHSVVDQVKKIITPIILAQNLELVDVEFKYEGDVQYLRIFIDKSGGVMIDDCQQVSRECGVALDVDDVIHTQYVLEVSSPGLDRPLKTVQDYARFQGHLAKIKTFRSIHGRKKFLGYLQGISESPEDSSLCIDLLISDEEGIIHIPYDLVSSARLEVEF